MIKKGICSLIFLFILSPFAYALDYSVQVNSPSSVDVYEGGLVSNQFSATITNTADFCDIQCVWSTDMNTQIEPGQTVKVGKGGGQNNFNFDVRTQGNNGVASYILTINCDRITSISCWSGPDQRTFGPNSFKFLYSGDGVCTTGREKCALYNQYLAAPSDCSCSSEKECKPDSNRGADPRGCATYCGNKVVEKQFEDCNSCPGDIGKCDGVFCNNWNECEGKYCVHNSCSSIPYITGDNFCDTNVGENCKNSGTDCACASNERCSNVGICETFCGNGICEANEKGVCQADCKWCGDGICQDSESCSSCSDDCGVCKTTTKEGELQRNVNTKTEQTTPSNQVTGNAIFPSFNENKTSYVIGIIVLMLVLGFLYYSYKKKKGKSPEEMVKDSLKCPKCENKVDDEEQQFCHHCGHKLIEDKKEENKENVENKEKPKKETKKK